MEFDVLVIGGGPGGYVAAIRAAQLGHNTACIEMRPSLGGTCLNVGCIPSKALLHASELFHQLHSLNDWGIATGETKLDLPRMLAKKDKIVTGLTSGIAGLFRKNKVTWLQGRGSILEPGLAACVSEGETRQIRAKHIIIATGSTPVELPFLPFDGQAVVDSTQALSFPSVPEHLLVVGGGVIGLELGSVWQRLGSRVTVVELLDRIAPTFDRQISRELQKQLGRDGMQFQLGSKVKGLERAEGKLTLLAEDSSGNELRLPGDRILVAVGRRPYTLGLGLENLGIELDRAGRIPVDERLQTCVPAIWAIGDVIAGPMLAHKAEEEGMAVAENLSGLHGHLNAHTIPSILYTSPEAAAVGLSEEELKASEIPYRVGSFPFRANSRGRCVDQIEGFAKILAHAQTDRILGVHILGPMASELIQEAVLACEFQASAEDLARTIHSHPGFGEAVREAALAVDKRAIHF
jgi:dihydrolipoamide dehydrogenase